MQRTDHAILFELYKLFGNRRFHLPDHFEKERERMISAGFLIPFPGGELRLTHLAIELVNERVALPSDFILLTLHTGPEVQVGYHSIVAIYETFLTESADEDTPVQTPITQILFAGGPQLTVKEDRATINRLIRDAGRRA